MENLCDKLNKVKESSRKLAVLDSEIRTNILFSMADEIRTHSAEILLANQKDLSIAKENNLDESRLSILTLTAGNVESMAKSLEQMAKLPDPVGERISYSARKDGLIIEKKWIPLGVVSVVYEARPDVVTDSAGICMRTGNALILCGSRHSFNTDLATANILKKALSDNNIDTDFITYIEDTSHDMKIFIARQKRCVDLMIIRGGVPSVDSLISAATVPYIVAGEGNCHIFIDDSADYEMAADIVINSKVPRPKACNAAETILISRAWADKYFEALAELLHDNGLKLFGCENAVKFTDHIVPAEENH